MLSCEQSLLLFWLFVSIVQTSYHFLNHLKAQKMLVLKANSYIFLLGEKNAICVDILVNVS